jgi:hypothetical protein
LLTFPFHSGNKFVSSGFYQRREPKKELSAMPIRFNRFPQGGVEACSFFLKGGDYE